MSDVVAVEYEFTREDWVSAMESYMQGQGTHRKQLRSLRVAFALTIAALVLLLLWGGWPTMAAITALLGGGWVAALPALTRKQQERHLRRIAEEGVANGTFGRHRVVLTDDGIMDSAEGYDRLVHWSAVDRVEDVGDALLVYNGPHSFLPIPLAAFPDRATFEAFSERFFRGLEAAGRLTALAEGETPPDGERGPSS